MVRVDDHTRRQTSPPRWRSRAAECHSSALSSPLALADLMAGAVPEGQTDQHQHLDAAGNHVKAKEQQQYLRMESSTAALISLSVASVTLGCNA